MSTDDATGGQVPPSGSEDDTIDAGTGGAADAEPTPGSDGDGAEAGYTTPSETQGSAGT